MSQATEALQRQVGRAEARPAGQLALCFQEAFTVTVRLRRNESVAADSETFRRRIKQILVAANNDARDHGYDQDDTRLGVYAFVAFLDESILGSSQAMFSDWSRKPLQEEVFGDHRAGETFFHNLRELLDRRDSPALADLLEVYQLCLLLGFRGRFGSAEGGEIYSLISRVEERIERIRALPSELSPSGEPPAHEEAPEARDPWARRLTLAAAGTGGFALILLVAYLLLLGGGVDKIQLLAENLVG